MIGSSPSAGRAGNVFAAEVDAAEMRRQLRVSLGLVIVLALGIVSAALSVGSHPAEVNRKLVSIAPVVVHHSEADPAGAAAI